MYFSSYPLAFPLPLNSPLLPKSLRPLISPGTQFKLQRVRPWARPVSVPISVSWKLDPPTQTRPFGPSGPPAHPAVGPNTSSKQCRGNGWKRPLSVSTPTPRGISLSQRWGKYHEQLEALKICQLSLKNMPVIAENVVSVYNSTRSVQKGSF